MSVNNRKNSLFIALGVGAILALILVFQWVLAEDEYLIEMKKYREKLVEMLKHDPDSPVPDSLKAQFEGPEFFQIEKAWRVTSRFEKNPKFQRINMPRTDGKDDTYIIAGWCNFKILGTDYRLTAYQPNPKDSKTFFIPFRDATTGKTTYGGGRYLDTRLAGDRVILDFNKAYNPYCVYDYTGYACPIPPPENTLSIAVTAGEKNFEWEQM